MIGMEGSPFAKPMSGPSISPATMKSTQRGGQQNPAYLQMRKPMAPGSAQTNPVITPGPTMGGDTVNPARHPAMPSGPPITPQAPAQPPHPPQAGGNSLGDVYNFFKSDLQNQAKQAKSGAIADASARGVYYGTPLTGSEADIDTQYQRGLGQFSAGMYGNAQQDQLSRLGMAVNLQGQSGSNMPPVPEGMDWSGLGALFGNSPASPGAPPVAAPRQGPAITPPKPKAPYDLTGGLND